jgi:hypothetical protein
VITIMCQRNPVLIITFTFKPFREKSNLLYLKTFFYHTVNIIIIIFSDSAAQRRLRPPRSRGFLITHNDTQHSVGLLWTSDQLVPERPLPDNTQQTNIHALGGIRTNDRSRRADLDLRLRPRGHWYHSKRYHLNYTYRQVSYYCIGQSCCCSKIRTKLDILCGQNVELF